MAYYNPMDEEYEKELYTSQIGASVNPMEHQTQSLKAKIFEGASVAEFGFMGAGKGNKQQFTPESFGKLERQDMRELAEVNKVETSTHASPGAGPLSGFSREGFNDEQRAQTLKEIKKAIDFAADASTGGAIVFHTGEWQRPISEKYGKKGFMGYPEEAEEAPIILADDRTGDFQVIKKNQKFYVPVEIDHIIDKTGNRVPIYKTNPDGSIHVEEKTFNDIVKDERKKYPEKTKNKPDEQVVLDAFFKRELDEAKGLSLYYSVDVDEQKKQLDKVKKALNFYKDLKKKIPEKDWWKVQQREDHQRLYFIPPDVVDPIEYLEKSQNDIEQQIRSRQELAMSYSQRAKQTETRMEHLKPVEDVGIKKTADTIASAAIFAMEKTKQHKNELKEDLFVAPESYDPKQYGSHPDEIRKIVQESRKTMVEKLTGPHYKMDKSEAKNYAEKHIKSTLDIGHFNTWRQFFERKDGESIGDADKRFNKWVISETKKLAKDGILGHIHISDNFGFDDEHLTAGQGNAPVKEFIEEMKKAGLKKFIVEAGSFNPITTLSDTWSFLGSPVYSISRPGISFDSWTNIRHSYFGMTGSPKYIVGDYSPSEDYKGAPWWSGVPLE